MQYQRLTDDTSLIVSENGQTHLVSSTLQTNKNVLLLRRTLLILISCQLVLCLISILLDVTLLRQGLDTNHRQGIRSLSTILLSMIYHSFGLFAIYRYGQARIYFFAWMGILAYLFICAEVFLSVIFLTQHPSHDRPSKTTFFVCLFLAILFTFKAVLIVIILKLTFKILNAIKLFKRDVLQQL